METATIVELVLFKTNEGVSIEEGKNAMLKLNDCVANFPGFVSRKTAVDEEGQFLDLVLWTSMEAATSASEKVMADESLKPIFGVINQEEMTFKHFEIFNSL